MNNTVKNSNKCRLIAVIALAALIVFSFTSCSRANNIRTSGDEISRLVNSGDWAALADSISGMYDNFTNGKKITITGVTGVTGSVTFEIRGAGKDGDIDTVAIDIWGRTIKDNSVTFSPWDLENTGSGWTGSGEHVLVMMTDSGVYYYTNGRTWAQLGISEWDDLKKLPKYNIRSDTSTIPFSQFRKWDLN